MPRPDKNAKRKADLRTARKRRLHEEFVAPYVNDPHGLLLHGEEHNDGRGAQVQSEESSVAVSEDRLDVGGEDGGGFMDDPVSDCLPDSNGSSEEAEAQDGDEEEEEVPDPAEYQRVRGAQQRQLFRVLDPEAESDPDVEGDEAGQRQVTGQEAVKAVSNFFVGLQARRDVPQKVIADVVDYVRSNPELLIEALREGTMPTFRTMRNRAVRAFPKVKLDVLLEDAAGTEHRYTELSRFPRKLVDSRNMKVVYTHYYIGLQDMYELHEKAHPDKKMSSSMHMSIDGIPESKASGLSLEVLSVRFYGCDSIYSIGLLQPGRKGVKEKDAILLRPFIEDLPKTELKLKLVIADAPKRASMQGLKTHAANYGCPYCYARKIDGKFPASTFRGEARTDADLRLIAEAIEAGEAVGESRGIKGRSLLASVHDFDLIDNVPADGMHLVCLGVVRRMMSLTYKGAGKRVKLPHQLADNAILTSALEKCKALAKFSRRPREFDVAVYKSEEYRNFVLVYWPVLLSTAPKATLKIWLLTVYVVRAYCLPQALYNRLDQDEVELHLLRKWYLWFEKTFTADQCTYSAHVFSHLDKLRIHGVLSTTSALRYENQYATIKQNYTAGTTSVGSQALVTCMLANLTGHRCKPANKLSLQTTARVEERFVFLRDERIVMLTHLDEVEVRGRNVPYQRVFGLLPGLDFSDVGVFKVYLQAMEDDDEEIDPKQAAGKVVIVDDYASVMFWSMFGL